MDKGGSMKKVFKFKKRKLLNKNINKVPVVDKYSRLKTLNTQPFKDITGYDPDTFNAMLDVLKKAHKAKKSKGGRENKVTLENMLFMHLEYMKVYSSFRFLAIGYGLSRSQAHVIVIWVRNVLSENSRPVLNLI